MSLCVHQHAMVPPAIKKAAVCGASMQRPHFDFKRNFAEQEADMLGMLDP